MSKALEKLKQHLHADTQESFDEYVAHYPGVEIKYAMEQHAIDFAEWKFENKWRQFDKNENQRIVDGGKRIENKTNQELYKIYNEGE